VPSYTVGYIDVYRNGVMLGTADFTATTGTTVVLASGATTGDLIRAESFYVSSVLNAIPATAGSVSDSYIVSMSSSKLTGTQTIPKATLPTGSVLQVVQSTYATQVDTTSTSYVTTGLTATITPSSSTSKVFIIVSNVIRANSLGDCNWTVFRGTVSGTNLASSGYFVYGTATAGSSTVVTGISINYLDSPATTSATTYTLGFKSSGVSVSSQHGSATATMTLMEIAA
jgi:hypothetical protein